FDARLGMAVRIIDDDCASRYPQLLVGAAAVAFVLRLRGSDAGKQNDKRSRKLPRFERSLHTPIPYGPPRQNYVAAGPPDGFTPPRRVRLLRATRAAAQAAPH